ncbi:hypothetical protein [Chryseobacterium pennipullorum]|uniref:Uncharacterized protein n=1 Tax=Chryseobacterium pennipullorum TaxID=2258963 RepID=A0A3D9B355_9FLAO|nr:hypothetical protein [Chryseobacterium pennipullorum]REC47939.1 hypothetical protein DRF67_08565 [Chryseobacterium pennipullorum]
MGKNLTEKEFKRLIQKHIKNTDFVKVYLDHDNDSAIFGFIVKFSDHFLMIEESNDFALVGVKIVPYSKVRGIRHSRYDKISKAIYLEEKLVRFDQNIIDKTNVENGESLFKSIKKQDFHCSIESKKNKRDIFSIGEILEIDEKSVVIKNYDPAGKFTTPHKISFKNIHVINFNDNYTKVFRKYLK